MNDSDFKKKALLAIETLRTRVRELEHATREAIAIVGYAAKFPGAVDAAGYWDVLRDGRDAVSEIPLDRWDIDAFYNADPDAAGKMVTRRAGLLDDVAAFDAQFFGIAPREAVCMDPQHRLMLETTWHAIEHACLAASDLSGTRTGVFMGLSTHEYLGLLINHMTYEAIDVYFGTGTSPAAGAGRISHRLGLEGPAVTVDTACSSSLVAVHQAAQALRSGECDVALAGGVNVILTPAPMINMSRARMLAPDGRCKSFDAAADGYVRGEGCGVVVLKRLSDAQRDGDRIRAVIRGSAVNQDGASGGLTVPNGRAQQRVIRDALAQAGLQPADIDYLEAHGTGTSLGDPIEVQAAGAVFVTAGRGRPILLGSAKTNIGHLEAAAGVAGVIKVVLALEHGLLPKHLHFQTPSPHIPWDRLAVRVLREAHPWPAGTTPRRAGISSFGFSGTNAHVVIEDAPPVAVAAAEAPPAERPYQLLPISARTADALRAVATQYGAALAASPDTSLADICYTAGVGRSHLEHRAALVIDTASRARDGLAAIAEDRPFPGVVTGVSADLPKTAWLFTGQGGQYAGMGRELYETQPVFRATLDTCAGVLTDVLPQPLLSVMFDADTPLGHTAYAQPALFALEMGLARLWQHWGLTPDVVLGHSVGQYAAACVAGVFSLEDGVRLLAERGRLFGALPARGRMAAIFADPAALDARLADAPQVSVAAYNGAHTVISGPAAEVDRVVATFQATGVRCERLDTSHAFHSVLLEPALDAFETYARTIAYQPIARTMICNRTGKVLTTQAALDAAYWRRHARQPVQFAESVQTLSTLGCKVLLEVGPQPVLTAMALRAWPEGREAPKAIASLRREVPDARQITEALAHWYVAGARPNFAAVDRGWPRRKVDLPAYPFQRRRFWFTPTRPGYDGSSAQSNITTTGPDTAHPLAAEPHVVADIAAGWLAATAPADREARLVELLRAEIAHALHLSADEIGPLAPFVTMGMDSLIAMELRSRIQAALGLPIPVSVFVAHANVASLAGGVLAWWLETQASPAKQQPPMRRMPRDRALELSFAQEQLWFLHELLPSSSAYNVAAEVRIYGPLDHATMARSVDAIVARHEVLRTTFRSEKGVPHAIVAASLHVDLPTHDVGDESEVTAWGLQDAGTPFDLATAPLFRVRLLRFSKDHQVLLVTMHHIITDGWSFGVLLRELGAAYRMFDRSERGLLPELPIQYSDYAAWQRDWLRGDVLESMLTYWKSALAGIVPLALSTDRPGSRTPSFRGRRIRFELGRHRALALRSLCAAEGLTLFIPLLAAFSAVLQRHSGQDDFVVGTMTANRGRLEIEGLIGLFVNALPLRVNLDGDPEIRVLLSRLRQRVLDAMAHQDAPFDLIVNAVERERDGSRNPLFQVQLVLQAGVTPPPLSDLTIQVNEIDTQTAKRDLTLTFFDDETLTGHVEYSTDLFDNVRIERLLTQVQDVLDAIVSDPGQHVSSLPVLTDLERALYAPAPSAETSGARSMVEVFEGAVDRAPQAVAVIAGEHVLTYAELDGAANRVARWLRSRGVGPNVPVALRVDRSLDFAVGMLGILKAGGTYVPIDAAYPAERIDYMLADANVALQLTNPHDPEILAQSSQRLDPRSAATDLAYIIYTSGSTGRPKGVMITHGSLVEYVETLGHELGIVASDVYLHTASISFSSSMRQMLMPLAAGAAVVIVSEDERRDPLALMRRVQESTTTVVDLVPTVVRQIVDALAAIPAVGRQTVLDNRLRLLLTASEPLRFGLVRDWRALVGDHVHWINMYGQTETTGIVSMYALTSTDGEAHRIVPIGRPRGNIEMLVLDAHRRPVPLGVAGDLYIGGPAVAQGYTGDPALTSERFIPHPLRDGERLYLAGDIARLDWDGTIEFLGRTDQQMKIRGLRIEPAEIERVLLEHARVNGAAIAAVEDEGEKRLVAYLTFNGPPLSTSTLRAHLRQKLPEHMVPSVFVTLDRMPVTPNGKLDRSALPHPERLRSDEAEFVSPQPGVEESLAEIWRQLLRVERVGAGDNFFALGGHSLLAAQVRSRIQNALGVDLPLGVMFEDQTLAALARRIEASAAMEGHSRPPLVRGTRSGLQPVSIAQETAWFSEQATPGSRAHWIEVALRIRGPLDTPRLIRCVHEAFERHDILRSVFRSIEGRLSQEILRTYAPDLKVLEANAPESPSDARKNLDVTASPPVQLDLVRNEANDHTLNVRSHRLLADGATVRLLLSEIGALYANSIEGTGLFPLLETATQYADYCAWEQSWLTPEARRVQVDFFRRLFADGDALLAVPTDAPRPARSLHRGERLRFELPKHACDAAHALAADERASLPMVLLAAFSSVIGTYTRHPAVSVAMPVSRRHHPATRQILGPFMNTLPLRIDVSGGPTMPTLVRRVKEVSAAAMSRQDAPFHDVMTALLVDHGPEAASIGEVAMVMEDPGPQDVVFGDLALARAASPRVMARRELTLSIAAANKEISGTIVYDRDLFNANTIQALASEFQLALASVRKAPA